MSKRGGIDLGGTKIQAVVVDRHNDVLGKARAATPTTGGPDDVAAAMVSALHAAADDADVKVDDLRGVGFGAPGAVDHRTGAVAHAGNLPGWAGSFPLAEKLSADLGLKVRGGNDVQVATEAEFELGAGKDYDSLLGVFWGTGVGGGIVLDGKEWAGRGAAGEIGHVVVEIDGELCGCGRRGCMEAYAGRGSMERRARELVAEGRKTRLFEIMAERHKERLASGVWHEALDSGDELAEELMARALRALGAGVASAINLLDVEAVIIGGGLGTRLGQAYADRIASAMQPHLFSPERPPAVHVASLGDLGGAIGASLLVA
jgi:glucokinase